MASKATMEFKRGIGGHCLFVMDIADYVPGQTIYFTAKPQPDNDPTDALAVINKPFTDADVDIISRPGKAVYNMEFLPEDIKPILYEEGETVRNYVGEFKQAVPGQTPVAFPARNNYINVPIYAQIRNENP